MDDAIQTVFTEWPDDAPEEFSREGLMTLAISVVQAVIKWIPKGLPYANALLIEHPMDTDGHTTPDLVTEEPGGLVITDWKYSHHVPADKVMYRLEGNERNHQFWHYIWAVGEHFQRPVSLFRKVVIVGMPKIIVKSSEFTPTPEALASWLQGARAKWDQMDRMRSGALPVYRREEGCKPFGERWPCPMYEACWTCHGDEGKMHAFYTKGDV